MFVSILCTAAIAVLLLKWNGRTLEEWAFYFSLNTTISTLTTAARVTLLVSVSACLSQGKWLHFVKQSKLKALDVFDEASRGPLGALTMILHVKTYLGLSTIAAAVTIFALGIAPVTQEVVDYEQGYKPVASQSAYFSFAHNYSSGAPVLDPGAPVSISRSIVVHLLMCIY